MLEKETAKAEHSGQNNDGNKMEEGVEKENITEKATVKETEQNFTTSLAGTENSGDKTTDSNEKIAVSEQSPEQLNNAGESTVEQTEKSDATKTQVKNEAPTASIQE